MLSHYFGILVTFIFAGLITGLFLYLSSTLGPKKPNPEKALPFETGEVPFETPAGAHAVKFYLAGMLFVLFDVELVFFFPWAVIYRQLGILGFAEMIVFLAVLVLGFIYAWQKGALQWK